jgi:hypothetical protein
VRERETKRERERYLLWSTDEVASVSNGNTKISAKVSSVCCVWERERTKAKTKIEEQKGKQRNEQIHSADFVHFFQ